MLTTHKNGDVCVCGSRANQNEREVLTAKLGFGGWTNFPLPCQAEVVDIND